MYQVFLKRFEQPDEIRIAGVCRAQLAAWACVGLIAATIGGRPAAAQVEGTTCGMGLNDDGRVVNLGACPNQLGPVYFAAGAISPTTLNMGASHGQSSQSDAEQKALATCQRSGSKDCVIAFWVSNRCAALATSATVPGIFGAATDPDRATAAAIALANCTSHGGRGCAVRVTPCAGDDMRWSSPLPLPPGNRPGSVDPNLVGIWEFLINPGYWIWEIGPNGTYTFHSEAMDTTPSHMGRFTASNGHYTMQATNMPGGDKGTYTYTAPGTLVVAGQHGTGTWHRIASDPDP